MPENVPMFPEFRRVTLGDKVWINRLFSTYPTEISERTFGSIFVWRNYENRSRLSQLDGNLIVSWFKRQFGRLILPPVGETAMSIVKGFADKGSKGSAGISGVFGIVEPHVSYLRLDGLDLVPLRDEWDYVYSTEDLVRLEGPDYHTQRKEMKKATSAYQLVYEPMTKEHQLACLELEETWCDLKHCTVDRYSTAEDGALKESLTHMDDLGFMGGVVLLDGKVQALTLGEGLNSNTAVVHFEKANPTIRGLYQVINQQFCEHALKDFEFVNREQDVGEPGLRRAKEGYHPHHFVEKNLIQF